MKKKKAKPKQRNFVAKYLAEFNRPKVEDDKRKKDDKHKNKDLDYTRSFSLLA